MQSRKEEMREQVKLFHENHPDVWYLFVKFTKEKIDLGFNNYSVTAIFERIRWEMSVGNLSWHFFVGSSCEDVVGNFR